MNYARTCHVFFFFLCYINLFFCITLPYCLFAIVCSMLWPNNGVPQKSKYDNDFHNRLHRHLTGCLFSALQKLQFLVFSNFWIHEENKLRYNASKDAQLRSCYIDWLRWHERGDGGFLQACQLRDLALHFFYLCIALTEKAAQTLQATSFALFNNEGPLLIL